MSAPIDLLAEYDPFAEQGAGGRRYLVVDAFAAHPLEGNPVAVFTDARGMGPQEMQRLARELNLSETVFVLPAQGSGDVLVRIFTPTSELPFAGHPVLGTATVAAAALGRESVTLETGAGPIPVKVRRDGAGAFAWMRQPVPTWEPFEEEEQLLAALGVQRSTLPVEAYRNGPRHVYVALESEQQVAAVEPDLGALARIGEIGVSCFAGRDGKFKTRMFAPALGVSEDPATGSAAGPLAVHLARHGRVGFGEEIEIRQGEEVGRPSVLFARAQGSTQAVEAVEVGGRAVLVAAGSFVLSERVPQRVV